MKVMRLSCWLFGAQWWFRICNSKLRVGINSGKLFTQWISFNICSKESRVGNPESNTLTRSGSRLLWRETSDFGIVEKSIRRAVTRLRSILQLDNVGMPMLALLAQIFPQLFYSITKSIPKHIKFIGDLYDNSQMVPTSWMAWHKEQKAADGLWTE